MPARNGAYSMTPAQEFREDRRREDDERAPDLDSRSSSSRELVVVEIDEERRSFRGQDGVWFRWSKFTKGDVFLMPDVGERVQITLDKAGFCKFLSIVSSTGARIAPPLAPATLAALASTRRAEPPDAPLFPDESERVVLAGGLETDAKGRAIARMNACTSAVAILASGGQVVDPRDVFALASDIERWIFRGVN